MIEMFELQLHWIQWVEVVSQIGVVLATLKYVIKG